LIRGNRAASAVQNFPSSTRIIAGRLGRTRRGRRGKLVFGEHVSHVLKYVQWHRNTAYSFNLELGRQRTPNRGFSLWPNPREGKDGDGIHVRHTHRTINKHFKEIVADCDG
jgi:hypothetical protein